MKAIIVNSTFATKGGARTILDQFIKNASKYNNTKIPIFIFVPNNYKKESLNNIFTINMNYKGWLKRFYWETFGLNTWITKQHIEPILYISLQNNGLFYKKKIKNIRQIIYYHQGIPFDNSIKWSFFKKTESRMWIYRYIYPLFIRASARKNKDIFIVQTNWMKDEMKKHRLFKKINIQIYKPDLPQCKLKEKYSFKKKDKYVLFYPAFDYKYKNHILLVNLIKEIENRNSILCNKIEIVVTLDNDSTSFEFVKENSFEDYFNFVGSLTNEEVFEMYYKADALIFPSLLESFGLPLLEAAQIGLPILSINKSYAREVLYGYDGVFFANMNKVSDWVDKLEDMISIKKIYENFSPKYDSGWKEFFNLINEQT
ncbi:glycosyltransferase [Clostridium sp. CS001]|uniref:glycosyltransferase n=1 Tax=Clostridium sp. CS001 TaxID=2880648 RepID=UPI001CF4846B|nr:glycosyltransferase [Clostridium sp. CS001]MCB2289987.1 glycosyltransferase [Clostridium sp. CS001]